MSLHRTLGIGEIHIPYEWEYADQTAREAAEGFASYDVGKFARQLDDNSIWMLTEDDPADWIAVGGAAGGLTIEGHKVLRQLIHFINDGPAEGFASGAYKVTTGGAFPTSVVWYDKDDISQEKIVEKLITWTGAFPTEVVWKIYDSGEVLLATVTDTITYSGAFETNRTRTIS